MTTLEFLKDKTKLVFEFMEDRECNSIFFYGYKESFEFFQNRQKNDEIQRQLLQGEKTANNLYIDLCYQIKKYSGRYY